MKKIIPASICAVLILPTVYFLIQTIEALNVARFSKEVDGLAYEEGVAIAFMQVCAMALILACLITIVTKILLRDKASSENKLIAFLLKYEIPAALCVILMSAVCCYAGYLGELSMLTCYLIALMELYLFAYPVGFFIINIVDALVRKQK